MTTKRIECQVKFFLDQDSKPFQLFDEDFPQLVVEGKLGRNGISRAAQDLIDLGIFVYLMERNLPGKQQMNRLENVRVRFGLREPGVWTPKATRALENLLLFMGGTYWTIEFIKAGAIQDINQPMGDENQVRNVVLFSGGLDSLCGAATLRHQPDVRLVSFYTRQKTLQRKLALELGMCPPVQWRWKIPPKAGRNRSFRYRSFFFLCLAAATGKSFNAHKIIQFENGILASGVAPSLSIQVTKHAHYRLHRLCETIFSEVLGEQFLIDNPFRMKTKREVFQAMVTELGMEMADKLASRTETCWNLYAGFKRTVKGQEEKKRNGLPCGFCVPCLIRKTSHPQPTWLNLCEDKARNDIERGRFFREYYNLAKRITAIRNGSLGEFYRAMDTNLFDTIAPRGGYNLAELRDLFLRFSDEFLETYDVK